MPPAILIATMVVIALDIGTIRVGCAVADDSVRIPFPVAVWPRAKYKAEQEILKLINERKAALLVAGLPLGPDGDRTAICDSIESFVRRLAKRSPEATPQRMSTRWLRALSLSDTLNVTEPRGPNRAA